MQTASYDAHMPAFVGAPLMSPTAGSATWIPATLPIHQQQQHPFPVASAFAHEAHKRKRAQEEAAAAARGTASPAQAHRAAAFTRSGRSAHRMPATAAAVSPPLTGWQRFSPDVNGDGSAWDTARSSPASRARRVDSSGSNHSDGMSDLLSAGSSSSLHSGLSSSLGFNSRADSHLSSSSSSLMPSAHSSTASTPASTAAHRRVLASSSGGSGGHHSVTHSPMMDRVMKRVCVHTPPFAAQGMTERHAAAAAAAASMDLALPAEAVPPPSFAVHAWSEAPPSAPDSWHTTSINNAHVAPPRAPAAAPPRLMVHIKKKRHPHGGGALHIGTSDPLSATSSHSASSDSQFYSAPGSASSSPPIDAAGSHTAPMRSAVPGTGSPTALLMPAAALSQPSSARLSGAGHRRPILVSPAERALLRPSFSASPPALQHGSDFAAIPPAPAHAHKRPGMHVLGTPPLHGMSLLSSQAGGELHRHKRVKDLTPAMRFSNELRVEAPANSPFVRGAPPRALSAAAAVAAATLSLQGHGPTLAHDPVADSMDASSASTSSPASWARELDALTRSVDSVHLEGRDAERSAASTAASWISTDSSGAESSMCSPLSSTRHARESSSPLTDAAAGGVTASPKLSASLASLRAAALRTMGAVGSQHASPRRTPSTSTRTLGGGAQYSSPGLSSRALLGSSSAHMLSPASVRRSVFLQSSVGDSPGSAPYSGGPHVRLTTRSLRARTPAGGSNTPTTPAELAVLPSPPARVGGAANYTKDLVERKRRDPARMRGSDSDEDDEVQEGEAEPLSSPDEDEPRQRMPSTMHAARSLHVSTGGFGSSDPAMPSSAHQLSTGDSVQPSSLAPSHGRSLSETSVAALPSSPGSGVGPGELPATGLFTGLLRFAQQRQQHSPPPSIESPSAEMSRA